MIWISSASFTFAKGLSELSEEQFVKIPFIVSLYLTKRHDKRYSLLNIGNADFMLASKSNISTGLLLTGHCCCGHRIID